MPIERQIADVFQFSEQTWARHANPWSVWTRTGSLILLVIAVWSRAWIGWWSLVSVAGVLLWIWLNPRLFPVPSSTNNWASKAVLGERVWLNRDQISVPTPHRVAPNILAVIAMLGSVIVIYGLVIFEVWPTVAGLCISGLGKMWMLDRMVWLYEEMKDATPEYRSWLY